MHTAFKVTVTGQHRSHRQVTVGNGFLHGSRQSLDLTKEPLGIGSDGEPVYLKDLWPSQQEISDAVEQVKTAMFRKEYGAVFDGDKIWQGIEFPKSNVYKWNSDSTYIR